MVCYKINIFVLPNTEQMFKQLVMDSGNPGPLAPFTTGLEQTKNPLVRIRLYGQCKQGLTVAASNVRSFGHN